MRARSGARGRANWSRSLSSELSRSASRSTIASSSASCAPGGADCASSSTDPEIAASGLRISCAMPAASRPTAASRSERRTVSSRSRSAVTS